jgi:hypothetical protein
MSSAKKPVTREVVVRLNNLATISQRLARIKPSKVKLDRRALNVASGILAQPRNVEKVRAIGLLLQVEGQRVRETADRLRDLPAAAQLTSGDLL